MFIGTFVNDHYFLTIVVSDGKHPQKEMLYFRSTNACWNTCITNYKQKPIYHIGYMLDMDVEGAIQKYKDDDICLWSNIQSS